MESLGIKPEEPSLEATEAALRRARPEATPYEVYAAYVVGVRKYSLDNRVSRVLREYGESTHERRESLGAHVLECRKCTLAYADYLDREALMELGQAKAIVKEGKQEPAIIEAAKAIVEMGYFGLIKNLDILGLQSAKRTRGKNP